MNDYKSIQDLIVKAALYDGISTTIGPSTMQENAIKIIFSKGSMRVCTDIDLLDKYRDPEEVALSCCKHALYDLLCYPYEEITCTKEG